MLKGNFITTSDKDSTELSLGKNPRANSSSNYLETHGKEACEYSAAWRTSAAVL